MAREAKPRELKAEDADLLIDASGFGYLTTDELPPLDEIVGQPRALKAIELGLGIRHPTYHIYVAGLSGTGKMETVRRALQDRALHDSVPSDWVYVNNFDEPDRPLAIELKAGMGLQLKRDLGNLCGRLLQELPKAFHEKDLGDERNRLIQESQKRSQEAIQELDKTARKRSFGLRQLPNGQLTFAPLKDDKPMTAEEIEKLSDEETNELEKNHQELMETAGSVMSNVHQIIQKLNADVQKLLRSFVQRTIDDLIDKIKDRYKIPKLDEWITRARRHILDHFDRFSASAEDDEDGTRFLEYQVNLLVDNSGRQGAPVVIEDAPTYGNVFGTIERVVDKSGRLVTNFTRIKAGSLLRANGGYLVLNINDALLEPFVWKELKRRIRNRSVEIEVFDPFSIFSTSVMKPDPIKLDTKVVLVGNPMLYQLLYFYDEDFRDMFKVKADFAFEMEFGNDVGRLYGGFVRRLSTTEELLPFEAGGVAALIRASARLAGDKEKLTTAFSRVADVVRQAAYWARVAGAATVADEHVHDAAEQQVYRSNLIAQKIGELISQGTLLISLDEPTVGQVNGLAVVDMGDYAFARPVRVTASAGIGVAGLVNVERESRMSGRSFDKAMLILEGYLRNKYARQQPIAVTAGLAMEQSYSGIEGDSASVAEILCLLSAIAEVPLRQDIAVTGSLNQWGQVQAVGGVNEKIEGFFDVCSESGLTGDQGVCIPASNVRNLILRPDVVAAIRERRFHLWAVEHVDEAIELLCQLAAGDVEQEGTLHGRVQERLHEMADVLKKRRTGDGVRERVVAEAPSDHPPDPNPPIPRHQRSDRL